MSEDRYTPAQASAVARLPLKAVHKLIDSRLIRPQRGKRGQEPQRLLSRRQLVYLRLEADGVRLLPLAARREVARTVEAQPDLDAMTVKGGEALVIEVKSARRAVEQELARLRKVQRMVVSDPEIMRGTPVFRGTRIPVELVADMLAQGVSEEEILGGYVALSSAHVQAAPFYMKAFPRRGRPVRYPWAGQEPIKSTEVPRRL
ncbi:MAG: DUF433 domain-containing protein [Acidobacteriaceae bacterium]